MRVWDGRSGWMGPGMRQVVGLGIVLWEGIILGVNVGHPIVTNGEFAA